MIPETTVDLESLLQHLRPAVRRQHPYIVGTIPDVQVKLNQNESPYDLPPDLKQAFFETFMQVATNRYPTEQPYALRDALAERLNHDPAGILIGNGSNELTYTLGYTMIGKGASVVLPTPMFALYSKVVDLFDGTLIAVPPLADLRFDAAALLEAVQQYQPAFTVLTTPNNPTGRAMPIEEIEPIVAAAEGFVVVDEAYVEFTEEVSAHTLLGTYPNLLLMRTFSKAFGLAGLRLGYMVGHPTVVQELMKARLPFMVDRLAESLALMLLDQPDLMAERIAAMKSSCRSLYVALDAMPAVEVVPSQANFVIFRTPLAADDLMHRLAAQGVLVRNMSGYPELQNYLRVNAGTPEENKAFLTALNDAL